MPRLITAFSNCGGCLVVRGSVPCNASDEKEKRGDALGTGTTTSESGNLVSRAYDDLPGHPRWSTSPKEIFEAEGTDTTWAVDWTGIKEEGPAALRYAGASLLFSWYYFYRRTPVPMLTAQCWQRRYQQNGGVKSRLVSGGFTKETFVPVRKPLGHNAPVEIQVPRYP